VSHTLCPSVMALLSLTQSLALTWLEGALAVFCVESHLPSI
jgi:hypothetical protein